LGDAIRSVPEPVFRAGSVIDTLAFPRFSAHEEVLTSASAAIPKTLLFLLSPATAGARLRVRLVLFLREVRFEIFLIGKIRVVEVWRRKVIRGVVGEEALREHVIAFAFALALALALFSRATFKVANWW